MKTSELLLKIKDLEFVYDVNKFNQIIRVYTSSSQRNHEVVYLTISAHEFSVNQGYVVCSAEARNLVRYILDYLDTPLEEREEEKRYYLRTPTTFNENTMVLNYYKNYYLFAGKLEDAGYKTKFTQKEIDDMQFDTNFFVKEEVK